MFERSDYSTLRYLIETMVIILKNIEYLKCFKILHKSLRTKYEKNYILPLIKDENTLISRRFSFAQLEINHDKQVCTFIFHIYSMCYEDLMLFQEENYRLAVTKSSGKNLSI